MATTRASRAPEGATLLAELRAELARVAQAESHNRKGAAATKAHAELFVAGCAVERSIDELNALADIEAEERQAVPEHLRDLYDAALASDEPGSWIRDAILANAGDPG